MCKLSMVHCAFFLGFTSFLPIIFGICNWVGTFMGSRKCINWLQHRVSPRHLKIFANSSSSNYNAFMLFLFFIFLKNADHAIPKSPNNNKDYMSLYFHFYFYCSTEFLFIFPFNSLFFINETFSLKYRYLPCRIFHHPSFSIQPANI